ncbi:MAG: hypothetical protein KBG84_12975 [Planctomycetes bacterium]|nr:hypothetical protein [Planctomycetota bacterium]
MRRVILTCLVLLSLAFISQAEAPAFQPIQRKEEVLKLEEENGKKVLKLAGERELSVLSLLRAWVEASGQQLMYSPSQLSPYRCTIASPQGGKTYDALGIEELVSDALGQFRMCLVEFSPGRFNVVYPNEIMSYAPMVTVDELPRIAGFRWVTLKYWSRYGGYQALANIAKIDTARSGPPSLPLGNWAFFCERADKLRELLAVFERVEQHAASREIKVYSPPASVDPQALAKAVNELAAADSMIPPVSVSVIGKTNILLVWAAPEQLALVPGLLKELAIEPKVAPPAKDAPKWEIRRYDLPETADSADVVATLEKLFDVARTRRLTVVSIPGKNALAVRALPDIHDQVAEFIELLK